MDTLVLNKDGTPLSVVPLSVISWQMAIRLLYTDKIRVLKEYEDWTVRSPSVELKVPSIVLTTDYIKWNRQVKYNRTNILLRDDYTCQYCNSKPGQKHLTVDHVLPRSKGGKTNWTNIVTACVDCNSGKGNDREIVPRVLPRRPSYYELMAKRQKYPLKVRDPEWATYLNWPEDLVIVEKRHKART